MKKVISFQLLLILILAFLWALGPLKWMPPWLEDYQPVISCILIATLAGVLYCIRAVYINYCVNKNWDERWEIWYYLRPLASAIAGFAAYIFLKVGIVALGASEGGETGFYGYLALSFIAGYNVDRFLKKIEDIAKSKLGVEQSHASGASKDEA